MESSVHSSSWTSLSPTADFYYRPSGEILSGSFRIVSVLPGQPDDPIICRTQEVSIHRNTVPFVALSYCWNSATAEESIWCDGRPVQITQNLFAALRNARATERPVHLWIDQICIDQSNIIDRNQQVSKMGAIYHAATGVVVWLGVEGRGTSGAMELARRTKKYWPEIYDRPELLTDVNATPDYVPPWGSEEWVAFVMLLNRPWFRRLWIIQEIACAKNILITCGTAAAFWDDFVELVYVVAALDHISANTDQTLGTHTLGLQTLGSKTAAQYIGFMQELREITDQGTRPAVRDYASEDSMAHHVLIMAKDCEATDHRDKLFAFHHLVRLWNKPDYAMDIDLLYKLFAVQYLQRIAYAISEYSCDYQKLFRRQLEFLYSAGICNQRIALPSWVPDWSVPWQAHPMWHETQCYHAGGDEIKEIVPLTEVDAEGKHQFELPITVKLIDRVYAIASEGLQVTRDGADSLAEALTQWIFQARSLLHFHRNHKCAYADQNLAIARTVLADQINGQKLAQDDAPGRYEALLESLRQPDFIQPTGSGSGSGSEFLEYKRLHSSVARFLRGRVFFITDSGRYGLAQAGTVSWGDEIAIIHGGPVPIIVRPTENTSQTHQYRLLCDTFVLGVMDGEAWRDDSIERSNILLV